ncbi:MAG: acyltransferase [Bacteroidota bacterium]|nr:acyltransferase [Bacteroidota bacterium]MDP4232700.1 acyltransferase [Bacteroidota bacterium]MDP4243167.1 acyltransferase [Bacteroidota bacterium]MDP4287624.1 acyltransferase [Bacteroidota bacterium]
MADPVFIHPQALVESDQIGAGTRVWAFAHVMKGARIGKGCNIGDHAFVESGVVIGDDVTIKNGVSVWDGVELGDRVFVGPNVAFTNDTRPRSKVYHAEPVRTSLLEGASIGANATILAGITVGHYAMIGAGAVVTKDVRNFELVVGCPARHAGWVNRAGDKVAMQPTDE